MKLLIVEDHSELLEAMHLALTGAGYHCETARDLESASEKIFLYEYDTIIVDINLPGGSGLRLVRLMKERETRTGIIIVSARNSVINKVEGLELGADDYITKPFDMAELIARVKSLERRKHFAGSPVIHYGPICIETKQREVSIHNVPVSLTKSEYRILLFFLSNQGRVITRESLAEHIWGDNMDMAESFDFIYSHIKNLRKKILTAGAGDPIKMVYGTGYKIDIQPVNEAD